MAFDSRNSDQLKSETLRLNSAIRQILCEELLALDGENDRIFRVRPSGWEDVFGFYATKSKISPQWAEF